MGFKLRHYKFISLIALLFALAGCLGGQEEESDSSSTDETCTYCGWIIEIKSIQTVFGSCSFNDCGYGSYNSCLTYAVMDVEEPVVGQIKIDPWIAGLLHGYYFVGTLDTLTGDISATHQAFPSSTLTANWDSSDDTMMGEIIWKPNASCEAHIEFEAYLNN